MKKLTREDVLQYGTAEEVEFLKEYYDGHDFIHGKDPDEKQGQKLYDKITKLIHKLIKINPQLVDELPHDISIIQQWQDPRN